MCASTGDPELNYNGAFPRETTVHRGLTSDTFPWFLSHRSTPFWWEEASVPFLWNRVTQSLMPTNNLEIVPKPG